TPRPAAPGCCRTSAGTPPPRTRGPTPAARPGRRTAAAAAASSTLLADVVAGGEPLAGELDHGVGRERLAGVDVDAEEQPGDVPRVEVRARRLPVNPSRPPV